MTLEERFWRRVKRTPSCWVWMGAVNARGYGRTNVSGRMTLVHRVALMLAGRDVPPRRVLMHACDNRRCVNPAHLTIGTVTDNNRDRTAKGRDATRHRRLTAALASRVRGMRQAGLSIRSIVDATRLPVTTVETLLGSQWAGAECQLELLGPQEPQP